MFRVKFRRISDRFDNIHTLSIIHRFQKIHTHLGRVGNHQVQLKLSSLIMRFGRHKKREFTFYVVLKVFNLGHFHPFTKSLDTLTHLL